MNSPTQSITLANGSKISCSLPEIGELVRGGEKHGEMPLSPPQGDEYVEDDPAEVAALAKQFARSCRAVSSAAPTLKAPTEWAALSGIRIYDIDGWRSPEEKDFSLPITKEEFDQRIMRCTVQIVDWEKFRPKYPDFESYRPKNMKIPT